MIPLKLQLKNFLSYGPTLQTIDFSPYNLICLSGKNGHGKSALLDAITWAIWGHARKLSGVAKPDNYLLRLGQQQMLVLFDFEFNGQLYRIRREFALTHGKQYASLDFGLLNNTIFTSLTNKTIRETQACIEATIGLDFESFINSAFLRQGQSNEFSKKSPKERKDILGTILGLNHYEILRKKAHEKVRNATIEISHIAKFQEKIELEIKQLPELVTSLTSVHETLVSIEKDEEQTVQRKKEAEEEKSQLLNKKNQWDMYNAHHEQLVIDNLKLHTTVQEQYACWKKLHATHLYRLLHDNKEAEKKKLIELITNHQKSIQKSFHLKNLLLNKKQQAQTIATILQSKFQTDVHKFEIEIIQLHTELHQKKEQLVARDKQKNILEDALIALKEKLQILAHELHSLVQAEPLQAQEQQFEKRKSLYYQWLSHLNHYKVEYENLANKQKFTADENNPSCPLCEQNLSASRKKFLKTQFTKQEAFLKHRLNRLSDLVKRLKEILIQQHAALETQKKTLECKKVLIMQQEELSKTEKTTIEEYNTLKKEYTSLFSRAQELEMKLSILEKNKNSLKNNEQHILTADKEYCTILEEITKIEHELAAVYSDEVAHEKLLSQLEALEKSTQDTNELDNEILKKAELSHKIHDICQVIKKNKIKIIELKPALDSLSSLTAAMEKNSSIIQELQQKLEHLKQTKEQLLQQKGRLEKEHASLLQKEQEFIKYQQTIKTLQELIYDYQIIANAVSKDGIQALIIEQALPEIEQEANVLLSQLTDNQAQIIIESLRDLKKGGTKETLDIKISDSSGIRPYELFSGGEAFRIDFALRLAISKLLARRAGTSLQTLIIDEGFGSQDEDGLSHIMDALYRIQDSFCKIIIVSHLPSMKDQFPVHFFVEKGTQGSYIRIIEQG